MQFLQIPTVHEHKLCIHVFYQVTKLMVRVRDYELAPFFQNLYLHLLAEGQVDLVL